MFASNVVAAEIVVRQRCVPTGPVVRLGDVADIGAATAAERDALVTTPLTPAPAAGVQRHLRTSEIRDLLALRGIDVARLHFSGATAVAIGSVPASVQSTPEFGPPVVDPAAVQAAVEDRILDYLRGQTGSDLWHVEAIGSDQRWQELAFVAAGATVSGGQAPWTGRQKFIIADRTGRGGLPIFARVARQHMAVIAVQAIERGSLISATDVQMTAVDHAVPTAAVKSLEGVIGQEARTAISAGAVLTTGNLRSPIVVRRGELATVFARASGVVAKTLVTPQQDGSVGDLVIVETGEGKKKRRFSARVSGYGELEVFAAPTAARELARK